MPLSRRFVLIVLLSLSVATLACARGHGHRGDNATAGNFDYWLMSLSWSPSFCESHRAVYDSVQCMHQSYGFVLHGLWPQNRNGSWPQHCSTNATPDESTIRLALPFMPSRHLIEHEWETHGACTGQTPRDYFAQAGRAFAGVKVPGELAAARPPQLSAMGLVKAFVAANPGMSENAISVTCHDGAELAEVRVCLNKDSLVPQACGGRVRNTCRAGKLRIPAP